jgi:hypothetical protein
MSQREGTCEHGVVGFCMQCCRESEGKTRIADIDHAQGVVTLEPERLRRLREIRHNSKSGPRHCGSCANALAELDRLGALLLEGANQVRYVSTYREKEDWERRARAAVLEFVMSGAETEVK